MDARVHTGSRKTRVHTEVVSKARRWIKGDRSIWSKLFAIAFNLTMLILLHISYNMTRNLLFYLFGLSSLQLTHLPSIMIV